ncbi:zinc finger protein 497 [Galendromus occidentalis]|uniref:Zinc finger protein 497 n=1 Tax=Galendromus occidentalis TaxID=34638 RepID=A0AAJ7L821_9ACAR|nr:zinc finger protein 497 [Galendromus occidentalis]
MASQRSNSGDGGKAIQEVESAAESSSRDDSPSSDFSSDWSLLGQISDERSSTSSSETRGHMSRANPDEDPVDFVYERLFGGCTPEQVQRFKEEMRELESSTRGVASLSDISSVEQKEAALEKCEDDDWQDEKDDWMDEDDHCLAEDDSCHGDKDEDGVDHGDFDSSGDEYFSCDEHQGDAGDDASEEPSPPGLGSATCDAPIPAGPRSETANGDASHGGAPADVSEQSPETKQRTPVAPEHRSVGQARIRAERNGRITFIGGLDGEGIGEMSSEDPLSDYIPQVRLDPLLGEGNGQQGPREFRSWLRMGAPRSPPSWQDTLPAREGLYRWDCPVCLCAFESVLGWDSHLRLHARRTPNVCAKCLMILPSEPTVLEHLKLHLADKVFPCHRCRITFESNYQLIVHRAEHGCLASLPPGDHGNVSSLGEMPAYDCPLCPARFASTFGLAAHRGWHEGNQSFQCTSCRLLFFSPRDFLEHRRTHLQLETFLCDRCDCRFRTQTELQFHRQCNDGMQHLAELMQSQHELRQSHSR